MLQRGGNAELPSSSHQPNSEITSALCFIWTVNAPAHPKSADKWRLKNGGNDTALNTFTGGMSRTEN